MEKKIDFTLRTGLYYTLQSIVNLKAMVKDFEKDNDHSDISASIFIAKLNCRIRTLTDLIEDRQLIFNPEEDIDCRMFELIYEQPLIKDTKKWISSVLAYMEKNNHIDDAIIIMDALRGYHIPLEYNEAEALIGSNIDDLVKEELLKGYHAIDVYLKM